MAYRPQYQPFDIMDLRPQSFMGNMDMDMDMSYGDEPSYTPRSSDPGMESNAGQGSLMSRPFQQSQPIGLPETPVSRMQVPTYEQPNSGGTNLSDLWAEAGQIYSPEYDARNRLYEFLNKFPERQSPGIGRGIAGILMGIGSKDPAEALKVMDAHMYAPYYRDLGAWKEQSDPIYRAAELENRANVNERTLLNNLLTNKYQTDRTMRQYEVQNEKNRISDVRARAYAWKQMHPDAEWDKTGPTYRLLTPDGKVIETGIKTGEMSREDELLLMNKGRVEAARVGAGSRERIAEGRNQVTIGGKPYVYNPDTNSYDPVNVPNGETGTPTRIGTPSTSKPTKYGDERDRQELMRRMFNNPDHRKFFTEDPKTGQLAMTDKPGYWRSQEEKDHYAWVYKQVHPGYELQSDRVPPPAPAPPKEAAPTTTGPRIDALPTNKAGYGEVMMRDRKTGKSFAMREENVPRALAIRENGQPRYERIQ